MTISPPRNYWDGIAALYQRHTRISTTDFHYGPLLAGDRKLQILPRDLDGKYCLEAGCGAGQNSIVLARRGARCVAMDASERQIELARTLARRCRVEIDFRHQTIESLPDKSLPRFDLLHSAHALAFTDNIPSAINGMARMLKPGGILLLATSHPLASAEPVKLGHRQTAALVTDYFNPEPDIRNGRDGRPAIQARTLPLGRLIAAVTNAGCRIERVEEPEPLPIKCMSESAIRRNIPYESRAWRARYPLLSAVPFTVIVRAVKIRV